MRIGEGAWLVLLPLAVACGESRLSSDGGRGSGGNGAASGSQGHGAGGSSTLGAGAKGGTKGSVGGVAPATDGGAAGAAEAGAAGASDGGKAGATNSSGGGSSSAGRGGSATSGSGGSSSSGSGGVDVGASGAGSLSPIEVQAPAAAAACEPTVCHVVQDLEAFETEVFAVNFRVATSADTTYLALKTEGNDFDNRLVALGADGKQVRVYDSFAWDPGLPSDLGFVAVDAGGAPHVAGTLTVMDNDNATIDEETWTGTSWHESWIASENAVIQAPPGVVGFEIGQEDTPTVFWEDQTGAFQLSTPASSDSWDTTVLFGEATDYALDAQGRPTLFVGGNTSYGAFDADGNVLFQVAVTDEPAGGSVTMRAARAIPQALAPESADMAVAALTDDGLHVILASRGSSAVTDVPIANTKTSREFALARTADGASWLSYLTAPMDGAGPTTWALHVVRIAPDGASQVEAFSIPLAHVPAHAGHVDSRAFGQRVVVAVASEAAAPAMVDTPHPMGVRVVAFEANE